MATKGLLFAIRLLVSLNLLYAAVGLKLAGAPLSIAPFNIMSDVFHGLISPPVFRIGSRIFETMLALLFLIPKTARFAAALILVWMTAAILSHIFVLSYSWFFVAGPAMFLLPCLYLFLTRMQSAKTGIRVGLLRRFCELTVFDARLYIRVGRVDQPA